jgi:hypothetical protein
MLLPDKHVTLAESILGLGAFLLSQLDSPKTIDQLSHTVKVGWERQSMPAIHGYDSVLLAVLFLYSIGVVDSSETGAVRRCDS